MGKPILGAVLGLVVLLGVVMGLFFGIYAVLGAEKSFEGDTWNPSAFWMGVMLVVNLGAAAAAGLVCRAVSKSNQGRNILVAIVIAMSLYSTYDVTNRAKPEGPRPAEVSMEDAMNKAQTPSWLLILNPLIGIGGIMWFASVKPNSEPEGAVEG